MLENVTVGSEVYFDDLENSAEYLQEGITWHVEKERMSSHDSRGNFWVGVMTQGDSGL